MNAPLRLLLIDDDELDRQAVMRALRQSPVVCHIVQAANAADGLKLAAEQCFDAILLDYRLPDRDGLEVLYKLRDGQFQSVAVVMLSRLEDDVVAERCLEAGAQDFLLKDEVTGRRLARAVRQARQRFTIETALKNSREQLRLLSEHDPLTGLCNRRGFEIALEVAIARVRRGHDRLAILLLDLDDFKSVNDTSGHDAGDALLVAIAQRLSAVVRGSDHLCRLGGDEFVVLMTDFEREDHVALLAERIIAMLQHPIHIGSIQRVITTSIGIAILDTQAENSVDLLKHADVAMYQAKQDGGNQCRFYAAELQESVRFRSSIKQDMRKALEQNEFKVYYQAQIDAENDTIDSVEALIRWHHPYHGVLTPASFMSIANESRLMVEIGNWAFAEACRQLETWQHRAPEQCSTLKLSVNLSALQINQAALPTFVIRTLSAHGLTPDRLKFEITESALIGDPIGAAATLSAIADQGITLVLDDFGLGYASLNHLRLFPINGLKVDKSFIFTFGDLSKSERLFTALIAFAKSLNMNVIAKGVETREQAAFCIRHGCSLLQGNYHAIPLLPEAFETKFLSHVSH